MAWYNPTTWFGSTKTVEKTADNLFDKDNGLLTQFGGWVGNMSFTDEEQAKYKMEVADKAASFVDKTLQESTVRSKTRRRLAVMWIEVELFFMLVTAAVAPFDAELARFYFELATCDVMLWGTGSIIVFFFGGYVWGTHIKKK